LNLQWKKKKTKKVVPKRKKSNCLKLVAAMKKLRTVQDPIRPLLVAPDDPDHVRLQDQDKAHDRVLDRLLQDDQDLNPDPGQDLLQAHEVDLDRDHPQDHVPKVLLVQNKILIRMTNTKK